MKDCNPPNFTKEYILCAAVKRIKERDCYHHYNNNDLYQIELGYRHCDIYSRFLGEMSRSPNDQGFYTSKGRFVDRKEAMIIAKEAGQVNVDNNSINLFSEDLY